MYITRLEVSNFRCFEHTEFELNYPGRESTAERPGPTRLTNVNMFLGDNGSGKSSVFKAAALGVLAPVLQSSGFQAEYLVRRASESEQAGRTKLVQNASVKASCYLSSDDLKDRDTEPVFGTVVDGPVTIGLRGDEELLSFDTASSLQIAGLYLHDSPSFFFLGYGANRRSERPEGFSERPRSPRYQRVAGLFEEHVGLAPFTYAYLQIKDSGRLEEARMALNSLLPEVIELTEATDTQKRPLFNWHGTLLPFTALSDGYRAFVAWVWDLLYQASSVIRRDTKRKLTDLTGVVIVDEIDLFLHPEWQRIVVQQVAEAFPNLQFLFSSHSPLVAGGLEPANIYVLEQDGVHQYQESIYGLTPSQVLTSSYFGLSSTRAPGTGTLSDLAKRSLGMADTITVSEQANPNDSPAIPAYVSELFDNVAAEVAKSSDNEVPGSKPSKRRKGVES